MHAAIPAKRKVQMQVEYGRLRQAFDYIANSPDPGLRKLMRAWMRFVAKVQKLEGHPEQPRTRAFD